MSITAKSETFFKQFQKLHATKPVTVDILNVANPDALPAPLTVSRRGSTSPHVNKLVVSLVNEGIDRLVVGGPTFTGVYINLSDLMSVEAMRRIKVSILGTPVIAEIRYRQAEPETITLDELTSEDRDPTKPPPPANHHLGTDAVLYVWPEKEVEIRPQESLQITLANTTSDFRPALRFLDVSWKLERRTFNGTPRTETVVEGLQQATIQLLRPADYVEPPFPLTAHWLNNNNLIYTAADDTTSLKNTLDFAISNIGLQDFTLDCNKHSRGVPYFELVMVGKKEGDTGDFSTAVADAADLVLAQIPDTTKNEDLNQLWRVNKRIQGPIVKWEIRPDLDFNFEQAKGKEGLSHKTLLGTDRNATITFRMSELRSKLDDGVALVYFRYYNMPDHDDGQIVLFLEKRRISTGGNMIAQLDKFENEVASPLRWRQEKVGDTPTTHVFIGDNIQAEGQADRLLDLDLTVLGDTTIDGDTTVNGAVSIGTPPAPQIDETPVEQTTKLEVAGNAELSGSVVAPDIFSISTYFLAGEATIDNHSPLDEHLDAIAVINQISPKFLHPQANPDIPVSASLDSQSARFGFLAENVLEVTPLMVIAGKNEGELYLDHPAMTTLLWQAVKDQQELIGQLNQRIDNLSGALENLDQQIRINDLEVQLTRARNDVRKHEITIANLNAEIRKMDEILGNILLFPSHPAANQRRTSAIARRVSVSGSLIQANTRVTVLERQLEVIRNS